VTTAAADNKPSSPPKTTRRRSGTATWHLSTGAVDLSVSTVLRWTELQCIDYLVTTRFGAWKTVRCPKCGTMGPHCWKAKERRWRCTGCRTSFSITSGTIFSGHKLPLRELFAATMLFTNSAAGQPALELRRHLKRAYNTVYVLQQKLREGMLRGHNVGLVNGDIEMDGAHQAGRRSEEKRGKPQISQPVGDTPEDSEKSQRALTQRGKQKERKARAEKAAGQRDPDFRKKLPGERRILFAIRQRSGVRGKGAVATRVGVGKIEGDVEAKSMVNHYVAVPESILNSDTVKAYNELGKSFIEHRTVEHSTTFRGPNGENNNQAEEYNWRYDRAEKGIYLNIEPKYILDYASEIAFRSDTRRLSNGKQLKLALHVAMSVGKSLFWAGFTHGKHRDFEFLHPENQAAPASGPPKGHSPISLQNGRPPR
jgi:transposase-like protein